MPVLDDTIRTFEVVGRFEDRTILPARSKMTRTPTSGLSGSSGSVNSGSRSVTRPRSSGQYRRTRPGLCSGRTGLLDDTWATRRRIAHAAAGRRPLHRASFVKQRKAGIGTAGRARLVQPGSARRDQQCYAARPFIVGLPTVGPTPQISGGAFRLFCTPCRSNFRRSPPRAQPGYIAYRCPGTWLTLPPTRWGGKDAWLETNPC